MMQNTDFASEIYSDYHDKVYGYIRSRVLNTDLSEDLTSEVFLKIYEKLDTFDREKASVSTWVFTITRNTLIDYYRVRKVNEEIPETMAGGSLVEDEVIEHEMLDELASALEKLDERCRDIIILHYYSRMTLKEIAVKLSISYAYVKVLHNKALETLKKYME